MHTKHSHRKKSRLRACDRAGCTHRHRKTHTYAHARIRMHRQTHTHKHTQPRPRSHAHTLGHTRMRHTLAHTHVTHSDTHTCTRAQTLFRTRSQALRARLRGRRTGALRLHGRVRGARRVGVELEVLTPVPVAVARKGRLRNRIRAKTGSSGGGRTLARRRRDDLRGARRADIGVGRAERERCAQWPSRWPPARHATPHSAQHGVVSMRAHACAGGWVCVRAEYAAIGVRCTAWTKAAPNPRTRSRRRVGPVGP